MKVAQDIYDAYRIMPSLQLHQLRVAATGKMIADHFSGPLDANSIVLACLFHDMGNIVKFEPRLLPELYEPEGIEYWVKLKEEFVTKYGNSAHHANVLIAHEFGLPDAIAEMIDSIGFGRTPAIVESNSFELKILEYSDMRVTPHGIRSMEERIEEGNRRYIARMVKNPVAHFTDEGFPKFLEAARTLEKQIFARCSIKPEDINDESAASLIEELRKFPIG